jgi:hypothetical protein
MTDLHAALLEAITEHAAKGWSDRLADLPSATFALDFSPPKPRTWTGPFVFRLHGRPKAFRAMATFETTGLSVIDEPGATITLNPKDAARLGRYIHAERYARLRRMHTMYPRRWKR